MKWSEIQSHYTITYLILGFLLALFILTVVIVTVSKNLVTSLHNVFN